MTKTLSIIILSALLAFLPSAIVWLHHQFVTGLNPFVAVILSLIVLVPVVFICRLPLKVFRKYISITPAYLFTIGLFSYLILACMLEVFYGSSALDIHLHDTYYVISPSYPTLFIAVGFGIFAAVYHWFYKLFKKQLNCALGYIHFWISFLASGFLLSSIQYAGLAGMPRRYFDYSDSGYFNAFQEQNVFISIPGFLLLMGQLLFVFNFLNSIFKKAK